MAICESISNWRKTMNIGLQLFRAQNRFLSLVNPRSAIERANAVPYGLAAYGFTNRADYADRMMDSVEAGNLSINTLEASLPETPFGGVKSSGYGREGGTEGLHNYMIVKNVMHAMSIT